MTKELPDLLKCTSWYVFNVYLLIDRVALCMNLVGVASKTTGLTSGTTGFTRATRMIKHQIFCEVREMKRYGFVNNEVYKCCMA